MLLSLCLSVRLFISSLNLHPLSWYQDVRYVLPVSMELGDHDLYASFLVSSYECYEFAIFTIYEKLFNLTSCSSNPTLEQYLYLCFFSHILITLVHCVTKKGRCQLSTITVVKLLQTCECFCLVGKNQFLFPNSSCCLVVCVLRCRACAAVLHVWCAAAVRSAGTRRWPESSTLPSCYWGPLLPASCCHQVWIISSNGYESNMETRSFLHARYNSFWPSETNTNIHQAVSHPTTAEVPLSKAPNHQPLRCVCVHCVFTCSPTDGSKAEKDFPWGINNIINILNPTHSRGAWTLTVYL